MARMSTRRKLNPRKKARKSPPRKRKEALRAAKKIPAPLRAPGGDGTIALHLAGPGTPLASDGVRLYFEIREVDEFCRKLQAKGFYITQMPRMMPWGWRHAYLNDPDGHEISIYWAGENRMRKTVMRVAEEVEQ